MPAGNFGTELISVPALLFGTREYVDIQDKTDVMAEKAKGIGLDVNIDKT